MINILDQETINKIAAGEVVERPSSVVKELVENAIDAGATAVTVEIKDGGASLIRVTDNGAGMEKEDVPTAFIRHATSKITTIEDLIGVSSLGFRGEALASIAAVAQVECITKTPHALTGIRYEVHGTREIGREEIGAPTGTTIIVRNLFYNMPARKKFLKTAATEGSYITELITRLALSKPEISFKYIINGSNKIATSGNGKLLDVIYHIYGKDVSANLLPVKHSANGFTAEGYIGKAFVSKGNRSFEHYFVNGRYIKSNIVTRAIEEGYKSFVMIHKFPFTSLHFTVDGDKLDVNVHPTKMEFKYADGEMLFDFVKDTVRQALLREEMIPDVSLRTAKEQRAITVEQQRQAAAHVPEPFETVARAKRYQETALQHGMEKETVSPGEEPLCRTPIPQVKETDAIPTDHNQIKKEQIQKEQTQSGKPQQLTLNTDIFISEEARKKYHIIGQLFQTYWLVEYGDKLYVMDQHAAHEKVMFERLMKKLSEKKVLSQQLLPSKILHLNSIEHRIVLDRLPLFKQTGFEIEDFGDDSIVIRSMPDDIMGVDPQLLFDGLLNSLVEDGGKIDIDFFVEKLSGMACKAAIKGNTSISFKEADALMGELLTLENPYNCPHGRPTMITISKTELERKFKRIQN